MKSIETREKIISGVDFQGPHIDKDILELVTTLNYLNIPTIASCQGHPEKKGNFSPFISISYNHEGLNLRDREVFLDFKESNMKLEIKILNYLQEFYKNRTTDYQNQIIYNIMNLHTLRLKIFSGGISYLTTNKEERKQLHAIYKKEFDDFTQFLKTK